MQIKHTNKSSDVAGLIVAPLLKIKSKASDLYKELNRTFNINIEAELSKRNFTWGKDKSIKLDLLGQKTATSLILSCWDIEADKNSKIADKLEQYRLFGSSVASQAKQTKSTTISLLHNELDLDDKHNAMAFLEGFFLTNYTFNKYKSEQKKEFTVKEVRLIGRKKSKLQTCFKEAQLVCNATILARDLVNTPPDDCTPKDLVLKAKEISRKSKLQLQVLDKKKLKSMGAGGILSVSNGSDEPPFLIKLTYRPKRKAKKVIALVGKGVTFDSGGLSMKPADGMMNMKIDMAGAAAVLGAMQAIGTLKPDVEVRAYIPTTENMINGSATRPGDVITAMNGKTIEVLNTDAEGRLILADALCLAVKEKADEIVDLATLTGAIVVALGSDIAAIYCNNQKLEENLKKSADYAGEKLWSMPLAKEYESAIVSSIADIKNIGRGRTGGSITAALFLKHFVGNTPWAHFDIAGTAESDSAHDYIPKGGVGFGVRTLVQYVTSK